MTKDNALACAECGAPLAYKPGAGALVCPFCGTENAVEGAGAAVGPWGAITGDSPIREIDYRAALANALDAAEVEETATVRCPGCAAEVGLDPATLADDCPFCATPLARVPRHTHRHPKPQGILPFALDERAARARMAAWLGRLWFAPSGLKTYAVKGRPLAGVYLPHYTFDAIGTADYRGQRGDAYFVTRTRTVVVDGKPRQQTFQERKIRWSPRSGRVRHAFDDVLVPASETMAPGTPGGEQEYGGQSWDLAALEPYRTEYLAGFRAEAPGITLEDGYARANTLMERMLVRDIKFDIGGDAQRIDAMRADYAAITFKHVLLPVWLASYRYANRPYRVAINGRTGEVSGQRPYSAWKIALAVGLGLIVAGAIGYLVATNT